MSFIFDALYYFILVIVSFIISINTYKHTDLINFSVLIVIIEIMLYGYYII